MLWAYTKNNTSHNANNSIDESKKIIQTKDFQSIVSFIWNVADDILRDMYVKGTNTTM
ncbi:MULTISPECIES: hypothetical protein [Helicobacter]|uniref:hypothetical protein n=1 Tax=Helicobacter TaxID=209 RepID=UPI003A5C7881